MRVKSEFFREQATRLRVIAHSSKDKATRDDLIKVAIEYDTLADKAEKERPAAS